MASYDAVIRSVVGAERDIGAGLMIASVASTASLIEVTKCQGCSRGFMFIYPPRGLPRGGSERQRGPVGPVYS